jgi:tetratricopeptide (TPR) repeat protein
MMAPLSGVEGEIRALVSSRRLSDATDLARATLEQATLSPDTLARVQILLSSINLLTGDPTSRSGAEAVLALAGLPDELYDDATYIRLLAALAGGDYVGAQELSEAVLGAAATSQGDPPMIAALTSLAYLAWREGRVGQALSFLRAAVRRAHAGWTKSDRLNASFMLALLLTTIGRFGEAADLLGSLEERDGHGENAAWAAGFPLTRGRLDLALGRLDAARAGAIEARAIAASMGLRTLLPACEWILATVALYCDELDDAAGHVEAYRADLPLIPGSVHTSRYILTEAEVADARGETVRASAVLAPVYEDLAGHRLQLVVMPTGAAMLTRRALAFGERERALQVATEAAALAAANPLIESVAAAADHARGLLDGDPTALARAEVQHLHPWAKASAAEDLGVLLAKMDGGPFAAVFERSIAAYSAAGATRDADRVRERLRQGGASLG